MNGDVEETKALSNSFDLEEHNLDMQVTFMNNNSNYDEDDSNLPSPGPLLITENGTQT